MATHIYNVPVTIKIDCCGIQTTVDKRITVEANSPEGAINAINEDLKLSVYAIDTPNLFITS